ncbi:MAG: chloride channel protein [Candidatus Aminicenantes bacterium]|nr:chloride channel protein [Candidatus Aminicenantes bacterium]
MKTLLALLQKAPEQIRPWIQTVVLSLSAALSAVGFLFFTNFLFTKTYEVFAGRSPFYFAAASFGLIMLTSLIVGLLLNVLSPDAAGSGIPQVKSAYWKDLGHMNFRPVLVKFAAGVLSIGGGNSLGREGPSVFIGSGISSNLAGALGESRREKRGASVVGASAGLAAAFNTPLAAITFAIEEIIGDLNSRFLGRVVLASTLGALVVYAILGRQPAFSLPAVDNVGWLHLLLVPLVAAVASGAGVLFQRLTLGIRDRLKKLKHVPRWALPVAGGFLTWVVGITVFLITGKIGVFGLGYQDLSAALNNVFPWQIAGLMVAAKLLATIIGYSFGGCGGIFAPSLFIGGMSGYFIAGLASIWLPLNPAGHIVLAAVGMSACLGAIVRAPLTSMLIVFEMTHQFALVPGLMLGMIISHAMARLAGTLNFYDEILVRDGHELHKIRPPLDLHSWQNHPVSAIANFKPVVLRTLDPAELGRTAERHVYNYFPMEIDGRLAGIVSRKQMLEAAQTGLAPEVLAAATCFPGQTVREVGDKFMETPSNVLIVIEPGTQAIRGIITLHDLIRAQAAIQA